MPEIQEFTLQAPTMSNDHFHVEKTEKEHQGWTHSLYSGDKVEAFIPEKDAWIKVKVAHWDIDDGSGNAPGANAHYFLKWETPTNVWTYDLHAGLRVRLSAPTDAELIAAAGWCEGIDWSDGYNGPSDPTNCFKKGTKYVSPGGQSVWFCDQHKPAWVLPVE